MTESTRVEILRTEELDADLRNTIIEICVAAHQEEDFRNLFSYFSSGGLHFLGLEGERVVSHAVVTARWLQPEGHSLLRTAYVDAVATLPDAQGRGHGSTLMRSLARKIDDEYVIGCLETDKVGFYERLGWESLAGSFSRTELIGRDSSYP